MQGQSLRAWPTPHQASARSQEPADSIIAQLEVCPPFQAPTNVCVLHNQQTLGNKSWIWMTHVISASVQHYDCQNTTKHTHTHTHTHRLATLTACTCVPAHEGDCMPQENPDGHALPLARSSPSSPAPPLRAVPRAAVRSTKSCCVCDTTRVVQGLRESVVNTKARDCK